MVVGIPIYTAWLYGWIGSKQNCIIIDDMKLATKPVDKVDHLFLIIFSFYQILKSVLFTYI